MTALKSLISSTLLLYGFRRSFIGAPLLAVFMLMCIGGLNAEDNSEAEPSLPPVPRVTPLIPGMGDEKPRSAEENLLRRLQDAVTSRDKRIGAIMDRVSGDLPATGSLPLPEINADRLKRDVAWRELEAALKGVSEIDQDSGDVLDTPAHLADEFQVNALTAQNQLDMARSYKALLEDQEDPAISELQKGFAIIRDISIDHLANLYRPQQIYLEFWFARELALRSTSGEQDKYIEITRAAHLSLTTNWTGSVSLILSANTLLEQLNLQLEKNSAS